MLSSDYIRYLLKREKAEEEEMLAEPISPEDMSDMTAEDVEELDGASREIIAQCDSILSKWDTGQSFTQEEVQYVCELVQFAGNTVTPAQFLKGK